GDDASRRRPVHLSARRLWPTLGFSLWLDAVFGDSNRNDRGRQRGLRPVSWSAGTRDLPYFLDSRTDQLIEELCYQLFDPTIGSCAGDYPAHHYQYTRTSTGQMDPKRIYLS